MEVYRRMGTKSRKATVTLSRDILYSPKRYDRRACGNKRLQHEKPPYANDLSKHPFPKVFRTERFQGIMQTGRYYAIRALSAQIHREKQRAACVRREIADLFRKRHFGRRYYLPLRGGRQESDTI